MRGEEEEEIEKVSVFALAFAVARLKGLVLFVLFFLNFLSSHYCLFLTHLEQIANGCFFRRGRYTREFVAIFRKDSGDKCSRNEV